MAELMRTNHTEERCIDAYGPNYGFGVFVRKSIQSTFIPGSAGTWFFADPKEELWGLFFTQAPASPFPTALQFEKMTYEALC
jgi:CubicO group peptidase (beta-lactamase class C family)|tara:strand:- start:1759 stop:2004 length:246 start_codon:yes stop_codon:yes gene_type:complete